MNAMLFLCITRRVKLTDSAEAVDVLSAGTLLRDVDVLEGLLTVVAQCQLQGHHAVAIDTGLAGEAVLGGQTFTSHPVEQLMGSFRHKHGRTRLRTCPGY